MSNGTADCPLILDEPDCHQCNTEYILTERVIPAEGVALAENNSSDNKNPVEEGNLPGDDIWNEQLPVF